MHVGFGWPFAPDYSRWRSSSMLGRIRLCNWVSLTIGCGLEWKDVSLPGAYFVSESLEVLCSGAPQNVPCGVFYWSGRFSRRSVTRYWSRELFHSFINPRGNVPGRMSGLAFRRSMHAVFTMPQCCKLAKSKAFSAVHAQFSTSPEQVPAYS